jgi:DivIVA domain-containing protein
MTSMELTPKTFRDVQFREKMRGGGYHHEDVDEFLEQAALGIEALQEKLRQATERAERAEQTASEAMATDEALRRMLFMAQRTADQAVREARQEAEGLVAEARAQAESILAEAEERGRQAYESALAEGRVKIQATEEALRQTEQEVEALRGWVDLHKAHLSGVLHEAVSLIEGAGLLSEPPPVTRVLDPGGQAQPAPPSAPEANGVSDSVPGQVQSGGWDPHFIDGLGAPVREPVPTATGSGPGYGERGQRGDASEPYASDPQVTRQSAGLAEEVAKAFDERALDTFFSEQDLADERAVGRFRRRQ